jgi:hypothetical protein
MGTVNLIEEIRPSSIKELAGIYGCCDKTMKKWIIPFLAEVGIKNGRYYSVAQVKVIFEKLGLPCKIQQVG